MADPDAVRQVRERARDREVSIWNSADGMGEVYAQLYATDAQALDARLNALVATVCAGDPRSTDQRRADALGALAAGADRLACRCDNPDCAAEGRPVSAVVIHVVAEQASVKGPPLPHKIPPAPPACPVPGAPAAPSPINGDPATPGWAH